MPYDITNPAVSKFLTECYEKQKLLRVQWNFKHHGIIKRAQVLDREPTNYYETDVIKQNMIGGMATITRDHKVAGYNRKKVPLRDAILPGIKDLRHDHPILSLGIGDPKEDPRLVRPDTDLSLDPVMRPVDPGIKKLLFTSKFGREQYLRKRVDILPDKKYYFPECSNWDYGWQLAEVPKKPEYGRRWLLTKAYSPVGPQPDPNHYRPADVAGHRKCTNA